jgi:hypothetical protein
MTKIEVLMRNESLLEYAMNKAIVIQHNHIQEKLNALDDFECNFPLSIAQLALKKDLENALEEYEKLLGGTPRRVFHPDSVPAKATELQDSVLIDLMNKHQEPVLKGNTDASN